MLTPMLLLSLANVVYCAGITFTPFCEKLLDGRNYEPAPPWNPKCCDLHLYEEQDVTACLENVESTSRVFQIAKSNKNRTHLHDIVFYGDSRVRQQYMTLCHKLLPKYDLVWTPEAKVQRFKFHFDADVRSSLLNSRFSYKWRFAFNPDVENDLRLWTTYPYTETPTLIIFGIAIHAIYMGGLTDYTRNLTRMEPLIRELASVTDVIWWDQDPVIDSHNEWADPFFNPYNSQLVAQYNRVAREILKDTGIRFWDSSQPFGREYVRGCRIVENKDFYSHRNCFDGNHMGFVVIEKTVQLLLNFYCNGFLGKKRHSYPSLDLSDNTCCLSQ